MYAFMCQTLFLFRLRIVYDYTSCDPITPYPHHFVRGALYMYIFTLETIFGLSYILGGQFGRQLAGQVAQQTEKRTSSRTFVGMNLRSDYRTTFFKQSSLQKPILILYKLTISLTVAYSLLHSCGSNFDFKQDMIVSFLSCTVV